MKLPKRAQTAVKYAQRWLRARRGVTPQVRARFREREQRKLEGEVLKLRRGDSPLAEGLRAAQAHGRPLFILDIARKFNKGKSRRRLVRAAGMLALDKFDVFAPRKRKEILELLASLQFQRERNRDGRHHADEEVLQQHLRRLTGILGKKARPLVSAFARNIQRLEQ